MVHSDNFNNGAGLDLHARTTKESYFSYMETASLRLGDQTLEMYNDHFFLNGEKHFPSELPFAFGDNYQIVDATTKNKNHQDYRVNFISSSITFRFYKRYLTVSIDASGSDFDDAVGLLGNYYTGEMRARTGRTVFDFEENAFEWQVNPSDRKLFLTDREPQLPYEKCRMPTQGRVTSRRLRANNQKLTDEAQQACAHVEGTGYDLCVDDVMITGDIGLAGLW